MNIKALIDLQTLFNEKNAEIERLTRELNERESTLASLCDCLNTFAREEGTKEADDYLSLSGVRDALSCVVYSLRQKNERLTKERDAARDAEAAASNMAHKFGDQRDEARTAARDILLDLKGTCTTGIEETVEYWLGEHQWLKEMCREGMEE